MEIGSPQAVALTRRALNARWLGASVLTGLAGAALLGSAIYVSSEGEITFAEPAERAPLAGPRAADEAGRSIAHKGDKLVRSEASASAKQSFRAPMTLRAGDREIIKLRPFVRLSTGLSLTSGVYATNIPPFNPLRFFTGAGSDRPGIAESGPETSDAEVSVVKSDLSMVAIDSNAPGLSDEDVAGQFREEARLRAEEGRRSIALPAPLLLSRTLEPRGPADSGASTLFPRAIDAPFRSLEVRVVPENVTTLAKTALRSADLAFSERAIPMSRGEALDAVLRANGAGPDEARAILAALGGRDRAVAGEGQLLRVLTAPVARPGEPRHIVRAILVSERGVDAIAALNDRGTFVSVTPQSEDVRLPGGKSQAKSQDDSDDEEEGSGVPLYDSLYETALKHDIPRQTIDDLVRIFGYDVDFQRRVAPGDTFELFCAADEEGGDRLEILSAALTVGSDVRRVFRYQAEDGSVDYFDEAGRSLKKFLIRKPVIEARLSSGFGSRYHPVLGYTKMHTGVDWAAKVGTPILAAGNGTISKAEWSSGYGRRIELQHANGYMTAYNHMSGFGRGIGPSTRVRQGQIIGYVGSTGLSTGAHLHFEVMVNGHFVDPLKIRVPRGRELDGRALTEFKRQREQIDGIMQKSGAPNRLAQSELR